MPETLSPQADCFKLVVGGTGRGDFLVILDLRRLEAGLFGDITLSLLQISGIPMVVYHLQVFGVEALALGDFSLLLF